jgi:hypothetical protein
VGEELQNCVRGRTKREKAKNGSKAVVQAKDFLLSEQ